MSRYTTSSSYRGGPCAGDMESGDYPVQISQEIANLGRTVAESKKKATWKFSFGDNGKEQIVQLIHSTVSGKKQIVLNGTVLHKSQTLAVGNWDYAMQMPPNHLVRVEIHGVGLGDVFYDLTIDNLSFNNLPPRGAARRRARQEAVSQSSQSFRQTPTSTRNKEDRRPKSTRNVYRSDEADYHQERERLEEVPPSYKSAKNRNPEPTSKPQRPPTSGFDPFGATDEAEESSCSFDPFGADDSLAKDTQKAPEPSSVPFDPFADSAPPTVSPDSMIADHPQTVLSSSNRIESTGSELDGLDFSTMTVQESQDPPSQVFECEESVCETECETEVQDQAPDNGDLWATNIVSLDITQEIKKPPSKTPLAASKAKQMSMSLEQARSTTPKRVMKPAFVDRSTEAPLARNSMMPNSMGQGMPYGQPHFSNQMNNTTIFQNPMGNPFNYPYPQAHQMQQAQFPGHMPYNPNSMQGRGY